MSKSVLGKYIGSILIAILLLTCSAQGAFAQQALRLVCDLWPPYQYKVGDDITGFSTEMVREVYASMGITTEQITPYPWKRAIAIVEHGHADGLFSANYTEDRKTFAWYPEEPLFQAPWVIWTRKGDIITSLEDLKGKRVGVVMGYSYTPEFWQFIETYCSVEKVSLDETNFKKLEFGRLDATVAEYGNGLFLKRKFALQYVTPRLDLEIKRDGLYIIFSRDTVPESFVKEFTNKLRQYKTSEDYLLLRKKYFGPEDHLAFAK